MRLALAQTAASELWKDFDPKVRNQIRKGEKAGLTVHWGSRELLGEFYAVFARNMRDLGTPVFGRKLFDSILLEFAGDAELCVVPPRAARSRRPCSYTVPARPKCPAQAPCEATTRPTPTCSCTGIFCNG